MNIPIYRPLFVDSSKQVLDCLKTGWIGYGPLCKQVEGIFSKRGGWAIATNSCTAALNVAARLLYSPKYNEVLIPPITFVSTAMAFLDAGWKVRLFDINSNNGLPDINSLKSLITNQTGLVVIVDLYGQQYKDIEELYDFLKPRGIKLLKDLAHRIDNLTTLPNADFCCYSFNAVKELTCGEGGLLWSIDKKLESKARQISYLGLKQTTLTKVSYKNHPPDLFTKNKGLKSLLSDIQASILLTQLDNKTIEERRNQRNEIFHLYNKYLETLPHFETIIRDSTDSFLMYVVKLETNVLRNRLKDFLLQHGISTAIHYPTLNRHPLFFDNKLKQASNFSQRILTLPCYNDLNVDEQSYVLECISKFR